MGETPHPPVRICPCQPPPSIPPPPHPPKMHAEGCSRCKAGAGRGCRVPGLVGEPPGRGGGAGGIAEADPHTPPSSSSGSSRAAAASLAPVQGGTVTRERCARGRGGWRWGRQSGAGEKLSLQSWGVAPRGGAMHRSPVCVSCVVPPPTSARSRLRGKGPLMRSVRGAGAAGVMGRDRSSVLLEITIAML